MTSPSPSSFYATTGPVYVGTNPASSSNNGEIAVVIDGGGATLPTGVKVDIPISFACTINSVTLVADEVGSIQIDVWKTPLAGFPPTVSNSICATDLPTLTAAQASTDATLTGWTTSILPGDVLRISVNSVTAIKRVTCSLQITKTG